MTGNLASQIRARREALGWSQDALAERAGVSQSTVDRVEKGGQSKAMLAILAALSLDSSGEAIGDATPARAVRVVGKYSGN